MWYDQAHFDFVFIVDGDDLSKEVRAHGFPIEHKHKLCCLRQELIDSFVEARYMMFIKYAAYHLQQMNLKKTGEKINQAKAIEEKSPEEPIVEKDNKEAEKEIVKDEEKEKDEREDKKSQMEDDEAKKIVESITDGTKLELEESTKNIVKTASIAVGSLKDAEFDIRFNPDVYSPGIKHSESLDPPLSKQRQLVKDAAEFLLTVQIPSFIRDCLDHSSAPMDGVTLSEAMHNRGINIRYLGKVTNLLSKVKQLEYLHSIAVGELILRSAKHIFTGYLQSCEMMNLSVAIAHFLNCFFYSGGAVPNPLQNVDEVRNSLTKYWAHEFTFFNKL